MRRLLLLIGCLPALMGAQFPTAIYNHINKNATCTAVPSDCGVGSEATCTGAGLPCLYTATKMNNVGDEVEAIETALGTNLSNVLKPSDINLSSELDALVDDDTGSGALCFATGPTLSGPVIATSTVAGLPAAGSRTGAIYIVTDGTGATPCLTGGVAGNTDIFCRDTGSTYELVGSSGGSVGFSDDAHCQSIDNLKASFDHKMITAFPAARSVKSYGCKCKGTCSTPAQLWLEDSNENPIGGAAVTCGTSTALPAYTDVSADSDGDLAAREPVQVTTTNTPAPETDEYLLCIVYE